MDGFAPALQDISLQLIKQRLLLSPSCPLTSPPSVPFILSSLPLWIQFGNFLITEYYYCPYHFLHILFFFPLSLTPLSILLLCLYFHAAFSCCLLKLNLVHLQPPFMYTFLLLSLAVLLIYSTHQTPLTF